MSKNSTKSVNCPTCETQVVWIEANQFRPFCSERCKLIDFGGWATEKHTIAGEPVFIDEESDQFPIQ